MIGEETEEEAAEEVVEEDAGGMMFCRFAESAVDTTEGRAVIFLAFSDEDEKTNRGGGTDD